MKRCPECRRNYYDDTLLYCLDDGNGLLEGPASVDEPATAILSEPPALAGGQFGSEVATRAQINTTNETAILPANTGDILPKPRGLDKRLLDAPILLAIIVLLFSYGFLRFLAHTA